MSTSECSLASLSGASSYGDIRNMSLGKIGGGDKEVLLKDYLEVTNSRTFFGRLWSQYQLKRQGKGEITKESLKLVDWKTLEKVHEMCGELLTAIEDEKNLTKPNLQEPAIGRDNPKSVKQMQSEWSQKVKELDKMRKKILHVDKKLIKESKRRDDRLNTCIKPLESKSLSSLIENPRLQGHFHNFLESVYKAGPALDDSSRSLHLRKKAIDNARNLVAMHRDASIEFEQEKLDIYKANIGRDQMELLKKGFLEYLVENTSEGKFNEIDLLDLGIAICQLKGTANGALKLQRRQEEALFEKVHPYTTDIGKKVVMQNPILADAYREYVDSEELFFRTEDNEVAFSGDDEKSDDTAVLFMEFMHDLAKKRLTGELELPVQSAFDALCRTPPPKSELIDEDVAAKKIYEQLEPYISTKEGRSEMMRRCPDLKSAYLNFRNDLFDRLDKDRGIEKGSSQSIHTFTWNSQYPFIREFAAHLAEQKAYGLLTKPVERDLNSLLRRETEPSESFRW